jgi:pilus assembly protein Flp/PilA
MGSSRRRQGLVETVLIVALIAIGTIGVVSMFGDQLRLLYGGSADSLAGDQARTGRASRRVAEKTLKNFARDRDPAGGPNGPE